MVLARRRLAEDGSPYRETAALVQGVSMLASGGFAGNGRGLAAPEPLRGGIGLGMPFNGYCDEEELPAGMMELHFHMQEILSEKRLRHKRAA